MSEPKVSQYRFTDVERQHINELRGAVAQAQQMLNNALLLIARQQGMRGNIQLLPDGSGLRCERTEGDAT